MDVFPQVPGVVRKSLDDLSNAALLLFNGCVELVMRRLCQDRESRVGFKEMLGPLAQKVEKRILAGNFAATWVWERGFMAATTCRWSRRRRRFWARR